MLYIDENSKLYKRLIKYTRKRRAKGKSWGRIYWELTQTFLDVIYDVEQEETYGD